MGLASTRYNFTMIMRFGRAAAVISIFMACWGGSIAWAGGRSAAQVSARDASAPRRSRLRTEIEVHKAARKLYLYRGPSTMLGEYKVALDLSPVGQKERERDFKTPEGRYYLARSQYPQ